MTDSAVNMKLGSVNNWLDAPESGFYLILKLQMVNNDYIGKKSTFIFLRNVAIPLGCLYNTPEHKSDGDFITAM